MKLKSRFEELKEEDEKFGKKSVFVAQFRCPQNNSLVPESSCEYCRYKRAKNHLGEMLCKYPYKPASSFEYKRSVLFGTYRLPPESYNWLIMCPKKFCNRHHIDFCKGNSKHIKPCKYYASHGINGVNCKWERKEDIPVHIESDVSVSLTQYKTPNGATETVYAEVGEEYVKMAEGMIFSTEILSTGQIALYARFEGENVEEERLELAENHNGDKTPIIMLKKLIKNTYSEKVI